MVEAASSSYDPKNLNTECRSTNSTVQDGRVPQAVHGSAIPGPLVIGPLVIFYSCRPLARFAGVTAMMQFPWFPGIGPTGIVPFSV